VAGVYHRWMPPDGPPAVGDEVELAPERFVAGGETLARSADGRIVFVRGAVPGDHLRATVIDARRDWSRASLSELIVGGPDRIEASCRARRAGCGGCDWAEVADLAAMSHKVGIVEEALRRTARMDVDVVDGGNVARTGYRTTMRLIGDEEGRPALRMEASNSPVSVAGCEVAHPLLLALIDGMRITPGLEVTVRVSAANAGSTARWDRRAGEVSGLPAETLIGRDAAIEEVVASPTGPLRLRVSAGSFFQSGPEAAGLLIETLARAVPECVGAEHLVDLYGGVGLLAGGLGSSARRLTVVESSRSATADALVNLPRLDPPPAEIDVVTSEVGAWRASSDAPWPDVVIADPARSGLGRPGVAAVERLRPAVLGLVSCDPVSMARDAVLLAEAGFRLEAAIALDLFPGSHHVEVVSRFVSGR
jgi:23S rRNA (uracil1939-C5)-methyltransferase